MINALDSSVYLSNHYVGQIFGNLHKGICLILHTKICNRFFYTVTEFQELAKSGVRNPNTLKTFIDSGLSLNLKISSPRYVSFFVPRKFDTDEKKNTAKLNLHMCVFTVRSYEGVKDGIKTFPCFTVFTTFHNFIAIYYDPSPKCFSRGLPCELSELTKPALKSFTKTYGVASGKNIYIPRGVFGEFVTSSCNY